MFFQRHPSGWHNIYLCKGAFEGRYDGWAIYADPGNILQISTPAFRDSFISVHGLDTLVNKVFDTGYQTSAVA